MGAVLIAHLSSAGLCADRYYRHVELWVVCDLPVCLQLAVRFGFFDASLTWLALSQGCAGYLDE